MSNADLTNRPRQRLHKYNQVEFSDKHISVKAVMFQQASNMFLAYLALGLRLNRKPVLQTGCWTDLSGFSVKPNQDIICIVGNVGSNVFGA